MAVAEFQNQGWDQRDCNKLAEACKTENITVEKQVGGPPYGGPSAEATLDIQYIKSLGGAIPLTNVYSEPYSLLHWAQTLSAMEDPPKVNSVSYGNDEAQQDGDWVHGVVQHAVQSARRAWAIDPVRVWGPRRLRSRRLWHLHDALSPGFPCRLTLRYLCRGDQLCYEERHRGRDDVERQWGRVFQYIWNSQLASRRSCCVQKQLPQLPSCESLEQYRPRFSRHRSARWRCKHVLHCDGGQALVAWTARLPLRLSRQLYLQN